MEGAAELHRYSVADDAWSTLPAPPAGAIVAAGDRLVAVGHTDEVQGHGDDWVLAEDGVAWTPLPPDPIGAAYDRQMVWTGDALVLLASSLDGPRDPTFVQAARLTDPFGAAEWESLPESTVLGGGGWIHAPWGVVSPRAGGADGGQVNGFGRTLPFGGVLQPDPPAWRELPPGREVANDVQVARTGQASTDGRVLLGAGWALDLSTGQWAAVAQNPAGLDEAGVGGDGSRLLHIGGGTYDQDDPAFTAVDEAWMWTAPPDMGTGGDPAAVELPTPEPYERPQHGPGDPDGAIDCGDDDEVVETNFDVHGPGSSTPFDTLRAGLDAAADIVGGDIVTYNESYASVVSDDREVVTARAIQLDDAAWAIVQATACSPQLLDAVVSR